MTRWTAKDIPPQNGRAAVVTGTGGLGFETALALSRAGANVVIAGRNPEKGSAAVNRIRSLAPGSRTRFERLDLADLGSVADFAERLALDWERLDILINNAGVMVPPQRKVTADGLELQFGTNYLGHFALTAHLWSLLRKSPHARVVSLSSIAAAQGVINFANLNAEHGYDAMKAYAQSKLACLMFGLELQRRSDAQNWGITSLISHPGVSRTSLLYNGPGPRSLYGVVRTFLSFLFQPAARGALPTLYTATAPEARPGGYYGPNGIAELRGFPSIAKTPPRALDHAVAARLWETSEVMAGLTFGAENDGAGDQQVPRSAITEAAARLTS